MSDYQKLSERSDWRTAEVLDDHTALLHLIARIREAAGDPEGKLMQPELVEHIRKLHERAELWDLLEDDRFELWFGQNTNRWYAYFEDNDYVYQTSNPVALHALEALIEEVEYRGWL